MNQKIKDRLCEIVFEHPDILGETLRSLCFVGEGLGCYSQFNVNSGLMPVLKPTNEVETAIFDMQKSQMGDFGSVSCYYHTEFEIYMFYWWDGDGTLGFVIDNRWLVNTDCKKTHGWSFGTTF